ncbi:hydroxyethylthiazole kinase [Pasteurellaceae bacterium LIM206]|nr:hydroxyethylthiazole kinase [Pasteurellaceae bacterium LIM206]
MPFHFLHRVKQQNPLVHCITNIVVTNFSANGLLALGASPFMSTMHEEAEDIQQFANGLLINIGTITQTDVQAMFTAAKAANAAGVPVVLDPVGVGATRYRRHITTQLLQQIQFAVIRGNISEIAFLAGEESRGKGVDAGETQGDNAQIAKTAAKKYRCVVAVSGETDVISDGERIIKIHNGTTLLPKVTGTGCLLGAVIAAFVGVAEKDQNLQACVEACLAYAVAGELAAKGLQQEVGTFAVKFIDQLAALTPDLINQYARVSYA